MKYLITLLSILTPTLGTAESVVQPMTYEIFEAAVPHIDLDTCPEELVGQDIFCRATLNHEEIHVFAFSDRENSPLTGFVSYPASALDKFLNSQPQ